MSQNIPITEQLSAQNKQIQTVILKDVSQTEESSQENNSNVCLNDTDEKSSSTQHRPIELVEDPRSLVPCKKIKCTPIELIEGINLREKATLLLDESLVKHEFGFCSEDFESEIEKALSANKEKSRDFVGEFKKSLKQIDECINNENKMYEEKDEKYIEKLKNKLEEANKNYKMASDEYHEFINSNPPLSYITQNDEKDAESNLKAVSDASNVYWEKHKELCYKVGKTHNESINLENTLKDFRHYKNNNCYVNYRILNRKLEEANDRYTTISEILSIEPVLNEYKEEIRTELRQQYNSYINLEKEKYNKLYTDYIDSKNPFLEFPDNSVASLYLNNKLLMEYEENFSPDNINPDNNSSKKIYFEGLYTYENRVNIWEHTPLPEQNVNIIYYHPKYMLNQKYIKSFKYYVEDDDLTENYHTCSSLYKGLMSRSIINNLNNSFSKIFVDSSNRENLTNQLSIALNFITPGLSSLFSLNKNEKVLSRGSLITGVRKPIDVIGDPENDFGIPKCGKYDENFYNGESIAEELIKKYFKEICSIFIFNLFLMSIKLNFNEMEKIMFKNIINKIFTEVLPEGKDEYRTLDYCLINLLKMDKSIIWIVKLLSNYDVCINSRDKKALLACYPKNKNFIKILDKIPETNTNSLFCTNISMEQLENIKHDEDELEQLENECIDEESNEPCDQEVKSHNPVSRTGNKTHESNKNTKFTETKTRQSESNSMDDSSLRSDNLRLSESSLFLSINGVDLSLKCSFANINISKNDNGKFSINIE